MPPRKTARVSRRLGQNAPASAQHTELVIYIHGIGKQPPPDQLKLEWDLALFGQDRGERTRMAYWADILHGTGTSEKRARRTVSGPPEIDVGKVLETVGVAAENEDAQHVSRELLRGFGVGTGQASGPTRKVLPLPGFLRRPIARAFLEALVGDTAAYFFAAGMRKRILERLIKVLPKDSTPVTIVAHSQGSIVAYEVLSSLPNLNVTEFVTIGSPLGIREVQDYLLPNELRVPSSLQKNGGWHNFADPLDPVALDKGIGNDFEPADFIRDDLVLNNSTWRIDGFNPHSAVGYLAHPRVRKVVHEAIRFDSMRRFVVARDVAEGLVSDVRQPVLIEILEPGYPALDEHRKQTASFEEREKQQHGANASPDSAIHLANRIARATAKLKKIVTNEKEARIDPLRRFVAAHLTTAELRDVAAAHSDLRVYAVWRSTQKRKLLHRSVRVMQADAARASYNATGDGITWAVLDTGVRATHPHFDEHSNIVAVWDCTKPGPPQRVTDPKDLDRNDRDGHGTHVAGIIAGSSPDSEETVIEGVAPRTKLVIYKVLNDKGEGEDAWIIKALDHIAEQNENSADIMIHGINLSLGGPYDSTVYGCGFTPVCQELRRQWRSGVLVCIAAGNEGQLEVKTLDGDAEINTAMSIGDPANLEDCIAVGSVNADKPYLYGISAFSSRGPTSDGRVKPDVVAPGERICSCNSRFTRRATASKTTFDRLYYEESGTSMAAPHVSGLLAAFLSVRREFRGRPDEVKSLLLRTCNSLQRDRYHQGHGIPNLMKMLLEA